MASLGRDEDADVLPVGGAAAATTDAYGNIYSGGTAAVGADGSGADRPTCLPCCVVEGCGESARIVSGRGIGGGTCSSAGAGVTVFPTASVGGAARAPAPADGAALTAAPATGGTVPSAASVWGGASSAVAATSAEISAAELATSGTVPSAASIRGAVKARKSFAGAVSPDAAAEAAPSTGGTAAPVSSTARAARKLASAAGFAGDRWVANICGERGTSTHPFDPGTVLPLEVRHSSNEQAKYKSNGGSSSSSNDNISDHDSWWDATCVGVLLRPFDPGKQYRRSMRRGKAVLGLDLPFDRGNEWGRMQHGG